MSPNKLTDTQLVLLSAASQREDGVIDPAQGLRGGLAKKAIGKLLTDGLVEEVPSGSMLPAWRRDDDRGPLALCITARGLAAIGIDKVGAGQSASLDHILRDAGLSDLKTELEQLRRLSQPARQYSREGR